ncbi:MAG: serine hydrolase [Gemmatimonadales bacterium]
MVQRKMRLILKFSVLLAVVTIAARDADGQSAADAIEMLAQRHCEAGLFHGGLLVADGPAVVYLGTCRINAPDADAPNALETPFPIHSITKSFTAILILQLVDEGTFELTTPLSRALPSFRHPDADGITLHHLLSHTSGLPDYLFAIPGFMEPTAADLDRDSVLSVVASLPLEFEPGKHFAYSNTGYVLLGCILERVEGKTFDEVLQERIARPLDMMHTHWLSPQRAAEVAPQFQRDGKSTAHPDDYYPGDGGIVSTLSDMYRFALGLGSNGLMSDDLWELAFTPQALPEDAVRPHPAHELPYGYGFSIGDTVGVSGRVVMHGGMGYGGSALLQRALESDLVVILWNNVSGLPPFLPGLDEILARGLK